MALAPPRSFARDLRRGHSQCGRGCQSIDIKRGLNRSVQAAVEALCELPKPTKTSKEKAQLATISTHNDVAISEFVAQAMEKVGNEGVIAVEKSKATETQLEVAEGMLLDQGYMSPYFITGAEKLKAILADAHVLICNLKINVLKDVLSTLEKLAKWGVSILFIAEDIEAAVLTTLIFNQLRGVLKSVAVKAPSLGDCKAVLQGKAVLHPGHGRAHGWPSHLRGTWFQT